MPPTPDSILAVLLDATADIHSATMTARADIACITDELAQLPPTGFTLARAMLSERRDALADDVVAKTRAAVTIAAAKLSLRTGPDGECDIDKPAIRPKGPPTKAEKAAREVKADPPPAMQAGEASSPDGVALFSAAVSDRGPEEPLGVILTRLCDTAISDWSAVDLLDVPEVAVRVIDRHRIGAAEAQAIEADRVKADGRWWTMSDDARVLA